MAVKSRKNWGKNEFLKELAEYQPVIVACDTTPPSRLAKATATVFSARLFTPKHSLHVFEKTILAKNEGKNAHERDAIAAARKAFNCMAGNKIRQFTRISHGTATVKQKELVLNGHKMRDVLKN